MVQRLTERNEQDPKAKTVLFGKCKEKILSAGEYQLYLHQQQRKCIFTKLASHLLLWSKSINKNLSYFCTRQIQPQVSQLFPILKKWVRGKRFVSNNEIIDAVNGQFGLPSDITALPKCWHKYINLNGDFSFSIHARHFSPHPFKIMLKVLGVGINSQRFFHEKKIIYFKYN